MLKSLLSSLTRTGKHQINFKLGEQTIIIFQVPIHFHPRNPQEQKTVNSFSIANANCDKSMLQILLPKSL